MTVRVGSLDELQPGEMRRVDAGGTSVVVVRVGDQVYACGGVCTHRGGPLAEGRLNGVRLVCPWHGWMFDVRTGACVMPARGAAVATYPVRIAAGDVFVEDGRIIGAVGVSGAVPADNDHAIADAAAGHPSVPSGH